MALTDEPFRDDLEARIKTAYPNLATYLSEVPEDDALDWNNGLFSPYVVLYFGGPIRAAGDHSLVSTRYDTTIVYCTMEIYAPLARTARTIKNNLVNLLVGYYPTDCGELTLEGGLAFTKASNIVRPTQYIESVGLSARSNLSWVS